MLCTCNAVVIRPATTAAGPYRARHPSPPLSLLIGSWVSMDVEAYAYALAINKGFQQLYQYIDGANRDAQKIPMTAPVRTKIRYMWGCNPSRGSCRVLPLEVASALPQLVRSPPSPSLQRFRWPVL